jgi:hypothetical protein
MAHPGCAGDCRLSPNLWGEVGARLGEDQADIGGCGSDGSVQLLAPRPCEDERAPAAAEAIGTDCEQAVEEGGNPIGRRAAKAQAQDGCARI